LLSLFVWTQSVLSFSRMFHAHTQAHPHEISLSLSLTICRGAKKVVPLFFLPVRSSQCFSYTHTHTHTHTHTRRAPLFCSFFWEFPRAYRFPRLPLFSSSPLLSSPSCFGKVIEVFGGSSFSLLLVCIHDLSCAPLFFSLLSSSSCFGEVLCRALTCRATPLFFSSFIFPMHAEKS
jgi:hypothetical protein